jgi:hypothetical protein
MKATLRLLIIVLLTATAPPTTAAGDDDRLLGEWQTPGGNFVEMRREADDSLRGYMVEVTDDARAIGFAAEQVALTEVRLDGDTVKFKAALRISDPKLKDRCPVVQVEFRGKFSGDGTRIEGELRKGEFETPERNGVVTSCTYKEEEGFETGYIYAREICSVECAPAGNIFSVRAASPMAIRFEGSSGEPLGAPGVPQPAVEVRARDGSPGGTPVSHAEVEWRVERDGMPPVTFYTETDRQGLARLEFIMLSNGDFAPANQIRTRPDRTLPAGNYRVSASVPALELALDTPFAVELRQYGLLIRLINDGGSDISEIMLEPVGLKVIQTFRIEIIDRAAAGLSGPLRVNISGDGITATEFEMPEQSVGYWRQNKSIVVYRDSIPAGFDMAVAEHVVRVTAEVTQLRVSVPARTAQVPIKVFTSGLAYHRELVAGAIHEYEETLRYLKSSTRLKPSAPPGTALVVDEKLRLLSRANALLADNGLSGLSQVLLAENLLRLVQRPDLTISTAAGRVAVTEKMLPTGMTSHPTLAYQTREEGAALHRAVLLTERIWDANFERMWTELGASIQTIPAGLKGAALGLIAAPIEVPVRLGNVIVTGSTLDGEDMTAIEQLLALKDMTRYQLNTPRKQRVKKWAAERIDRVKTSLEEFDEVRERWGLREITRKDLVMERVMRRHRENGWQFVKELLERPGSDELKGVQFLAFDRIWSSKVAENLREKLAGLRKGNIRRDIGFLYHWLDQLIKEGEWEEKVRAGLAVRTKRGGYREKVDGKLGDIEEIFEWKLPNGKRLDRAVINHRQRTICISDIAAQLRPEHLAKTVGYRSQVRKVMPGYRIPPPYELYWDEVNAKVLERLMYAL